MQEEQFTFCVCTYNSADTLDRCLASVRALSKNSPLLVVDHHSGDSTLEISKTYSAEILSEDTGLGRARQICLDHTRTDYLIFVDSDVQIIRRDFLSISERVLRSNREFGAIVGMAMGHRLTYGLPASLLALRRDDFCEGKVVPDYIDARETFFIQQRLDELGLKTYYLMDAIRHTSKYRKFKPEWEGANTRLLPSPAYKELPLALKVTILLSFNSASLRNIVYIPIFYSKFLRGFANPKPWLKLKRKGDT